MASGYHTRGREAAALTDALVETLDELRKSDTARAERHIADILRDPDVRKVLEREVVKRHIPTRTFSPLMKGLQNYSSFAVNDGELTSPAGLPSAIAKGRMESKR